MFGSFSGKTDHHTRRRLAFSTGASAMVYAGISAAILLLARDDETIAAVKEVAVVFQPPPPPAPRPPPAAKPAPKPLRPRNAAAPPARLLEVERIPKKKLEEAEPKNAAVPVDDGSGDASGTVGGTDESAPPPPPPPPKPKKRDPINLPETATPPVPDPANAAPEYPEEARLKGLESQVILKVVISESGRITKIMVMRGEEPFVSAALRAVESWRYSPAIVEGQATPVFRILKIPFRLK